MDAINFIKEYHKEYLLKNDIDANVVDEEGHNYYYYDDKFCNSLVVNEYIPYDQLSSLKHINLSLEGSYSIPSNMPELEDIIAYHSTIILNHYYPKLKMVACKELIINHSQPILKEVHCININANVEVSIDTISMLTGDISKIKNVKSFTTRYKSNTIIPQSANDVKFYNVDTDIIDINDYPNIKTLTITDSDIVKLECQNLNNLYFSRNTNISSLSCNKINLLSIENSTVNCNINKCKINKLELIRSNVSLKNTDVVSFTQLHINNSKTNITRQISKMTKLKKLIIHNSIIKISKCAAKELVIANSKINLDAFENLTTVYLMNLNNINVINKKITSLHIQNSQIGFIDCENLKSLTCFNSSINHINTPILSSIEIVDKNTKRIATEEIVKLVLSETLENIKINGKIMKQKEKKE